MYQLTYTSVSSSEYGKKYIPLEVETYLLNHSGKDESGYFAPLEYDIQLSHGTASEAEVASADTGRTWVMVENNPQTGHVPVCFHVIRLVLTTCVS